MLGAPPPKIPLTDAQLLSLKVLAANKDDFLPAWKRSSIYGPRPRLNIRCAGRLVMHKLAERKIPMGFDGKPRWSPYTHDETYRITDAGLAQLRFHYGFTQD